MRVVIHFGGGVVGSAVTAPVRASGWQPRHEPSEMFQTHCYPADSMRVEECEVVQQIEGCDTMRFTIECHQQVVKEH